jgi:hypothetical protein
MSDTVVSVSYDRKFADGNYGSEGLSLSWTVTYEDETDLACDSEIVEARCNEIAAKLRVAVLQELSRSRAYQVARAARQELEPSVTGVTEDLEDLPL